MIAAVSAGIYAFNPAAPERPKAEQMFNRAS